MSNILDFLKGLRGEKPLTEDQQRLAECFSSGLSSTGNLMPFSYAPRTPLPIDTRRYSAAGEVYALKEAGRALLADLDSQPDWAIEWGPDRDVVERFRALVEPK